MEQKLGEPTASEDPQSISAELKPGRPNPSLSNATTTPSATTPSAANRGRPRYEEPAQPKADQTISGRYADGNGQTIEIEGVAKISENSIVCWDMQGNRSKALEEKVAASLKRQSDRNPDSGPSLNLRYGKKNRVIIIKTTRVMAQQSDGKPRGFSQVLSAGSTTRGGSYIYLDLQHDIQFKPGEPYIQYDVRTVSEDLSKTTTTVRISEVQPTSEQPMFPCKVGSTFNFLGRTYKITNIAKGAKQSANSGGNWSGINSPKIPFWTITLSRSSGTESNENVVFSPVDAKGQNLGFVDKGGNLVTVEEYQKRVREAIANRKKSMQPGVALMAQPGTEFYPAFSGSSGFRPDGSGETMSMQVFVNPAKIPLLKVHGSRTRYIDITGIPLDPKG